MNMTTSHRLTTHRSLRTIATLVVALAVNMTVSACAPSAQIIRKNVSQSLNGATSADIGIAMAIGHLRIDALDQPNDLITGIIAYPEGNHVEQTFAMRDDVSTFTLHEQDSQRDSLIKYRGDNAIWDLHLAPSTPLRLTIETGVGENVLDLARLTVTDLDLKTGIGPTTLTLPHRGQIEARIESGIGDTRILIPSGIAVRVALDAEIGNVGVPDSFLRQGNKYVSPDYDTATNRAELTAISGVGTITIAHVDE